MLQTCSWDGMPIRFQLLMTINSSKSSINTYFHARLHGGKIVAHTRAYVTNIHKLSLFPLLCLNTKIYTLHHHIIFCKLHKVHINQQLAGSKKKSGSTKEKKNTARGIEVSCYRVQIEVNTAWGPDFSIVIAGSCCLESTQRKCGGRYRSSGKCKPLCSMRGKCHWEACGKKP